MRHLGRFSQLDHGLLSIKSDWLHTAFHLIFIMLVKLIGLKYIPIKTYTHHDGCALRNAIYLNAVMILISGAFLINYVICASPNWNRPHGKMNELCHYLCVGCVLLVIDELSTSVDATNGWETNRTHTKTYVVSVVSLRSQFTYLPSIAIWIWITICMCAVHSVYIAHYQFTNIPNLWCLIIFYDNFFQFSTTDSISRITI